MNIYSYNDYRLFMRDYFESERKRNKAFSTRYFAARAGFSSHSFCGFLIRGERNLSLESVDKVARALSLKGKQADFFRLLVAYTQARTTAEKERLFKEINILRRNTSFYKLNQNQYAYFEQWYYPILRELAVFADWHGDYEHLARLCVPSISAVEAKKAVSTLCEMNLLVQNQDGTFSQTSEAVTGESLPGHLVKAARKKHIELALNASENMRPAERNLSAAIVGLSAAKFSEASQLIDSLRERIVAMAAEDQDADKIYQINFQLFPVSDAFRKQHE